MALLIHEEATTQGGPNSIQGGKTAHREGKTAHREDQTAYFHIHREGHNHTLIYIGRSRYYTLLYREGQTPQNQFT